MSDFISSLLDKQQIQSRRYSGQPSASGKAPPEGISSGVRHVPGPGNIPIQQVISPRKTVRKENVPAKPALESTGSKGANVLFRQTPSSVDKVGQQQQIHRRAPCMAMPEDRLEHPTGSYQSKYQSTHQSKHQPKPLHTTVRSFFASVANLPKTAASQPGKLVSLPFIIAVSATAFFLLAGVIVIAYTQAGSYGWSQRSVVAVEGDAASQHNLALYVGAGASASSAQPAAQSTAQTAEQAATQPVIQASIQNHNHTHDGDADNEQSTAERSVSIQADVTQPALPLDLMESFAWQSYRVKKGDSVSGIAAAFSVSLDAVIASNGITNARALREGQVLRIPNMNGIPYTVKRGDTLSGISRALGVPMEAILDANDLQSDRITVGKTLFIPGARMNREELQIALGEKLFIHPVRGARVSSPFGWRNDPITGVRRHHSAVDLAAPQGTLVATARDGQVSAIGFDRTLGNFVIISHSGGFQTLYAHLHTVTVKKGDTVKQGGRIGTVGSTGYSTGPHLHFAVFRNNRAVNPLDFISSRN